MANIIMGFEAIKGFYCPGKNSYSSVLPIIFPIFNIPLLLSSFLPLLLCCTLAIPANPLNSGTDKKKDWGRSSFWSFFVYYIFASIFTFLSLESLCSKE